MNSPSEETESLKNSDFSLAGSGNLPLSELLLGKESLLPPAEVVK